MESVSARHLISAAAHNSCLVIRYPSFPIRLTRFATQSRRFRFALHSKKPAFQDFQGYANPSRLLPATEPEVCTDSSLEKVLTSFKIGGPDCLYKVKIHTSSIFGSGLSNLNAGVLLCLIDENGDSILQRIPTSLRKDHSNQSEDKFGSIVIPFQKGSVDVFTFKGPKLGKIDAIWISLESGQWRLGGASLIVACGCQPTSDENIRKEVQYIGTEYRFEVEDTLLGEGSDISMVEVRPCLVREFSGDNLSLLSENLLQPTSIASNCDAISKEESMREYADLKLSLLLYDALLVFAGSSVASVSAGENAAIGFLSGGIVGFLYLLLIQRSVDGLAATSALTSVNERGKVDYHILRRFMGPAVSRIALAFTLVLVAVRYGSRDFTMVFTAKELMFGMLGFLACKVAVVLAVFKPIPMAVVLEENK